MANERLKCDCVTWHNATLGTLIEIIRIHVSGLRFDKSVGIVKPPVPKEELISHRCNDDVYSYREALATLFFPPNSWTTPTWRMRRGVIVNYRLLRLTRNSCHEFQLPSFPSLARSPPLSPCIALFLVTCSSKLVSKLLKVIVTPIAETTLKKKKKLDEPGGS